MLYKNSCDELRSFKGIPENMTVAQNVMITKKINELKQLIFCSSQWYFLRTYILNKFCAALKSYLSIQIHWHSKRVTCMNVKFERAKSRIEQVLIFWHFLISIFKAWSSLKALNFILYDCNTKNSLTTFTIFL